MQTILSTQIENRSILMVVSDLIKKNPVYQLDGKHDRMLVAEVTKELEELGLSTWSDSITREARIIRYWNKWRKSHNSGHILNDSLDCPICKKERG